MIFIRNFQYCLFHVCYITTSMSATLPLPCLLHYLFHVCYITYSMSATLLIPLDGTKYICYLILETNRYIKRK